LDFELMDDNQQNDSQQEDINQIPEVSVEQLKEDLNKAMDGWKRTAADFENFRRRKESENKELVEFAREVTVAKLLPTLDSLEQALRHMPAYEPVGAVGPFMESSDKPNKSGNYKPKDEFANHYQNWQSGINGIVIQLNKALEELGIKKVEAVGKKFDPHFHEAIREVESEHEDGMVVDEVQTGFELNGKLIRPSQVIISKRSAKGG
jgi:molecular chaperone GrpE